MKNRGGNKINKNKIALEKDERRMRGREKRLESFV